MGRDELAKLLDDNGIMATPQRLDIAELVLSTPQHRSADQVIAGMRKRGARVSKATVYNTLNLFRDKGLLRTVQIDPERQYYDSTSTPHHHFYNVDTGELIDIPVGAVKLDIQSELPPGTEHAGVEVVVRIRSVGATSRSR